MENNINKKKWCAEILDLYNTPNNNYEMILIKNQYLKHLNCRPFSTMLLKWFVIVSQWHVLMKILFSSS